MEREEEKNELARTRGVYTRKLLQELDLGEAWDEEDLGNRWGSLIRERIHEREQVKWRSSCLLRPKLRTYSLLKKELKTEPYLEVLHRGGIPELSKIRGGANRLRIEQGRYVEEKVEERLCVLCQDSRVEGSLHVGVSSLCKREREDVE